MADKNTAAKEARTTPYVVAGVKDPSKVYVQIAVSSAETKKVIHEELGGVFKGGMNKWEVDKAKYEGAIEKVDAAYAADNATRATKSAEKPAKAEVSDADKEAAKAKRAADGKARAADRDASRVLVDADTVCAGNKVTKGDVEHEVNHVGDSFEKDGKQQAYAYFGDLGAELAAKAEAKAAAAKEAEDASPSP